MIIGSSSDTYQLSHPFRELLQITVISVMRGTFSGYLWDSLHDDGSLGVWGPSCLRHVCRHCENLIYKRFSDYHDGDDDNDDGLRTFSWGSLIRQGLQPTRLFAIRRSGSPASLTRASRLINLPQPSDQLGAAWPARHRWQYVRRQAASGSCSHPSLTSRPHKPQRPAWHTPRALAPQQGPPGPQDALQLRPTPCGRRKRCRRRPASPTPHPEDPDRPR